MRGGALRRRKPRRESRPFVYTGVQMVSKRLLEGELPDGPFSTNMLWDRAIASGPLLRRGPPGPVVRRRRAGQHQKAEEMLGFA